MSLFTCPVCHAPLTRGERTCHCPAGHSFDIAVQGYVHLLPVQKMHAKVPGDTREMIAARRRFLESGTYRIFSDGINQIMCQALAGRKAPAVLDAGCGEGYYTARLYDALRARGAEPEAAGFDISKFAVRAAAKRYPAIEFAVASMFDIPVADRAADAVMSVFAPIVPQQMARVCKSGGTLLLAVPGPRHLYGMKEVLYERPYENERRDISYSGFRFLGRTRLVAAVQLEGEQIMDLFAMTPYYWKTPREGVQRLAVRDTLETELEIDLLRYQRTE